MAPSLSLSTSTPMSASATPVPYSPYRDDREATLANNILCPRYAESIIPDNPVSPASIESFDILDSIAWRRGYISHDASDARGRAFEVLRKRWNKNKAQVTALLLLLTLLVAGCAVGGWAVIKHEGALLIEKCEGREGGKRCEEKTWANCVAANGLGYCEGIM